MTAALPVGEQISRRFLDEQEYEAHSLSELEIPVPLVWEEGKRFLRINGLMDHDGTPILAPLDNDDQWEDEFRPAILRHRYRALLETEEANPANRDFRRAHAQLCIQPHGIGHMYWLLTFGWVQEPRNQPTEADIPFILMPRQMELILHRHDTIARPPGGMANMAIPKTRSVGVTWIAVSHHVWGWMWLPYWNGLLFSYDEEAVDNINDPKSMFTKADYLIKKSPRWMWPEGFDLKRPFRKKRLIHNPATDAVITGEVQSDEAGRGARAFLADFDEAAFNRKFTSQWSTMDSVTDHKIAQSTASRIYPGFYELVHRAGDFANTSVRNFYFTWDQWVGHDANFLTAKQESMPEKEFRREILIDWEADFADLIVFPQIQLREFPWTERDLEAPSFLSIDDGWDDNTALVYGQIVPDQPEPWIDFLATYQNRAKPIRFYGTLITGQLDYERFEYTPEDEAFAEMLRFSNLLYPTYVTGDRHGYNTSMTDGNQPFKILSDEFGIVVETEMDSRRNEITDRRDAVIDHMHRFRFSREWDAIYARTALAEARFPKREPTSQAASETPRPVHDKWSHIRTAIEYLCMRLDMMLLEAVTASDAYQQQRSGIRALELSGRRHSGMEMQVNYVG